jgi:para-nitrobenzyl esterase
LTIIASPIPTASGPVSGIRAELGAAAVTVFKGIPYAAAPTGHLRWRPPQPPETWDEVRLAHEFGPICPQTDRFSTLPHTLPMHEDCLTLNVWTAAALPETEDPRPVLVWIHGGRFVGGSGADPRYDGAALAAAGLVVVTFNYRTGVFGFLAAPELSAESGHACSGNYGLLDQIAALRWVQVNIAAFGGDPDRVTIAGQSAGAACVQDLVYSPLAKGLFHRAIAQSGALHPRDPALAYLAGSYRTLDVAEQQGTRYLKEHGAESIEELRALPVSSLLEGNDADDSSDTDIDAHHPPLFRPVLDGHVFPRTYHEALTLGPANDVPIITGTNKDENGASPKPQVTLAHYQSIARATYGPAADEFLALYPASTDAEAAEQSNEAARDRSRVSTCLWSTMWAKSAKSPVFTYFWTHPAPGPDAAEEGASHGSEINYVFNNLHATDRPWTDVDRRIADRLSRFIVNFAATGDPNAPGLPVWPAADADLADPAVPQTMQLGGILGSMPVATDLRLAFHRRHIESQPAR